MTTLLSVEGLAVRYGGHDVAQVLEPERGQHTVRILGSHGNIAGPQLDRSHQAARQEAELSNLPVIVQHLQQFKYRRAFWLQRVAQLNGKRDG